MTSLTELDTIPGVRAPDTAHVRTCDASLEECDVCHSWWEELLTAIDNGRVEVPAETEQTELPI